MEKVHRATEEGRWRDALHLAVHALDFVDGMMRYMERYEERADPELGAVDFVCRFAPLLLENKALDQLEVVLKEAPRIARKSGRDLAARLLDARLDLERCYQLWSLVECGGGLDRNDAAAVLGRAADAKTMFECWVEVGLLEQSGVGTSARLRMVSRLDDPAKGKCLNCGAVNQTKRRVLYHALACRGCGRRGYMLLMAS
jgi:hypothetical protein